MIKMTLTKTEIDTISAGALKTTSSLDTRGLDPSNTQSCCVYDKNHWFVLNPYSKQACNVVCELVDPQRLFTP